MAFCITQQSQIARPGYYHPLWLLSQTTESPASQEPSPLLQLQQPPTDDRSWQFISHSHRVLQWQSIAEPLQPGFRFRKNPIVTASAFSQLLPFAVLSHQPHSIQLHLFLSCPATAWEGERGKKRERGTVPQHFFFLSVRLVASNNEH